MKSLKLEFSKFLQENYLERITEDISNNLVILNEDGILLRSEIIDLTALDNDDDEFRFKIKVGSEVLKINGTIDLFTFILEYTCLLDDGIKNLKLLGFSKNTSGKFAYKEALTDYFIPFNKKENYDNLAIRFLKYYLKSDYKNYPLNVIELVEKIGLKTIISTNVNDSLGKIIFKDCELIPKTCT